MTKSAVIRLPFPISVNAMFADGKHRRTKSKRYEAWIAEAGSELMIGRHKMVAGEVSLTIDLIAPDRRRRDCTNYIKGVEDLLVKHGVIQGDDSRFVRSVTVGWTGIGESGGAIVTVEAAK